MVSVQALRKHYTVHKRPPGLRAALGSLFRRVPTVVKAVDGISFEIGRGERVGFLGPNGAGKTTTLKVLAGLLHPSSGEVRVDGHVPQRREDAFLKKITLVMGQKQQLLWDLPPSETFALNRAIYEVPEAEFRRTLTELTELLELGDLVNKPTRTLSLGERMKCELAASLIHRPQVLFLDEPTIGLDVSMQVVIRDFIKTYNERTGATLILTSHYMDDVAALCPRVLVIDRGKLFYDGSLTALAAQIRSDKRIVLRLDQPVPASALAT
ncbi:MAG: ABC transporter ATP-binding protein, partial [Myxococcaceae bacterium]